MRAERVGVSGGGRLTALAVQESEGVSHSWDSSSSQHELWQAAVEKDEREKLRERER